MESPFEIECTPRGRCGLPRVSNLRELARLAEISPPRPQNLTARSGFRVRPLQGKLMVLRRQTRHKGERQMIPFRVIAIPTEVAVQVRISHKAPRYGHPAYTSVADGYGPCRHCLRTFRIGAENRTLFTYDPFMELEQVPLPGPIFVHTNTCERYPEEGGYPEDLRAHAAVMSGFAKGQRLVAQLHVDDDSHDSAVQQLLARSEVEYIEVRDKVAGCYDFRIERARQEGGTRQERKFKC